jgi:hypothetical protein
MRYYFQLKAEQKRIQENYNILTSTKRARFRHCNQEVKTEKPEQQSPISNF